jgi:hypothetical protein
LSAFILNIDKGFASTLHWKNMFRRSVYKLKGWILKRLAVETCKITTGRPTSGREQQ